MTSSAASGSVACPACLEPAARPAFSKDGYQLRRCTACGFLFVSPYPSEAELARFYADPVRAPRADFFNKAASRRRRAWARSLKFLPYVMGKAVLDVGCGGGRTIERLAAMASDGNVFGIDYAPGSVAASRSAQKLAPELLTSSTAVRNAMESNGEVSSISTGRSGAGRNR